MRDVNPYEETMTHRMHILTLNPSQQAMDNAAWDATASQFNECRTKMYASCVSPSVIAMSCTPNLKLASEILSNTRRRKNLAAKDADGSLFLHSIQDWVCEMWTHMKKP